MTDFLVRSFIIGAGATLALDLWALLLNKTFGLPMANWGFVGRWVAGLPAGRFVHEDIGKAAPVAGEKAIGWAFHYAVGWSFAMATLLLAGPAWKLAPTAFWPLIVGWVTVGCGWFILAPGMGAGIAASKRPNANRIRMLNIVGHTIFGLAMWAIALAIKGWAF